MNRDNVINALQATTVGDNQKVESFLDERTDLQVARSELASCRTTTSSSDGADWCSSRMLTNGDERSELENCETEAISNNHVNSLMERWRNVARRTHQYSNDPWSHFFIYEVPITRAKRYRYSSIRKSWTEDIVEVRLHSEPFARGAMRECYRLKKLASSSHANDWKYAHNYVAKKYIEEVERSVFFEDVKLQMDAKLWAEEFNRYDPPKKIDIVQMCVLEMLDMPSNPLFHLEHYIEGDYIKYNSNSGFVSEIARKTPQAFSHFTFERSGHQMMVVDIQGVGDLYTDPQIHTAIGTDYGDGNLGTRGMALFFHSHLCNDICHSLCLTEFDLSEDEQTVLKRGVPCSMQSTVSCRQVSACSAIVPDLIPEDAMECLRQRTISMRSRPADGDSVDDLRGCDCEEVHDENCVCDVCLAEVIGDSTSETFSEISDGLIHENEDDRPCPVTKQGDCRLRAERRSHCDSFASSLGSSSFGSLSRLTRETEKDEYWLVVRKKSIPAGLVSAIEGQQLATEFSRSTQNVSVLGQIHLDLARYHEMGKFLPERRNASKHALENDCLDMDFSSWSDSIAYDKASAFFHLDVARRCGLVEAIITIAQMAYGMPHDLLKNVGSEQIWLKNEDGGEEPSREEFGFELMKTAAEMGDRSAMLFVAEAYETGRRMGLSSVPSYPDAIKWYEKAVGFADIESGGGVTLPRYEVLAKMAKIYEEGGCGLTQNFELAYNLYTEAAEVAIEAMKGKLANKYYEQAEMCFRRCKDRSNSEWCTLAKDYITSIYLRISRFATETLTQCSKQRGFTPELLDICCDASVADPVRQAAVIYFKNTIVRLWEVNDDSDDSDETDFCLSDEDKALVKTSIIDAVCAASESLRTQLCIAIQQIIRMDYPDKWPQFVPQLTMKLSSPPDASVLSAGLLILYRLAKVYEFKRNKDRDDISEPISKLEPFVYYHCHQLMGNQSAGSVLIQIQGLKIIYVLTQFSIHFGMLPASRLDEWIQFSIDILGRECPAELDSVEDRDERAHTVWWKCKKWAAKILDRVFDRYGSPNQVEKQYAEFANHFLTKWSRQALEAMLLILNAHRNGVYVSDRVLYLALSFTNTAVAHSHCWRTMKPHALELIKSVLFRLMSFSKADEEMWEDNAEEYVRFKFDIFEDLHNPAAGAGALLRGLAKRKDIVQPVLAFAVQILQQSSDPCEAEGSLRMIGELSSQLTKSKKYKKDVEQMLDALVISRLRDPSKFVRARAAWCLKEYSDAYFHSKLVISKVSSCVVHSTFSTSPKLQMYIAILNKPDNILSIEAVDALIHLICDGNEELPVKVEAALAVQSFLKDQERANSIVKPHVRSLVLQILDIVSKAQIDDVISVVDELLEQFVEEVIPVAAEVAEHLSNLFLEILTSDAIDDRTPALNSIIPTLGSILDLVEDHREVMVHVEASVLKPINCVLTAGHIEFYDDIIILLQSLLQTYVSEPMWDVYVKLYKVFKSTDRQSILPFSEIAHVLHMYIVVDNESFLAFPDRMNAMIDMCQLTLQEDDSGDENHLYAAKILETIILECGSHAADVMPTIIVAALRRLMKPSDEEGLKELRPLLFLVIVASMYTCTELCINYICRIAEPNQNPLDYICEQLVELNKKFEGIHNRRLALFGICIMFLLPSCSRPSLIGSNPQKVLEASLSIFDCLQRALKIQAQARKEDSETEESDFESDDDGHTVAKTKKGARHRKVESEHLSDDEDEIDEMSLDYIDAMTKECKLQGDQTDDNAEDNSDSAIESSEFKETDTEQFATKFDDEDGPDVFVFFKQTMELLIERLQTCSKTTFFEAFSEFERREPELFSVMVRNLAPEVAESLQNLVKVCEQHVMSEESKRVEQAGGYNFNPTAAVPASFNFTK